MANQNWAVRETATDFITCHISHGVNCDFPLFEVRIKATGRKRTVYELPKRLNHLQREMVAEAKMLDEQFGEAR